ncbi:PREDICTED: pentatricopeptide repeat-containing protein 1, mitochondrial-like [Cyprinodon variegatus]|uniref:Pentatricopeptide repeat domain 1 n=1 Tax=Cyprinodon variegatus TaxID=28743 RepID=A0A3Q2E8E0_CYPVA|nr:PREDICTED: pentatricopeptide repeat-containing protein 1, mitochondrial-like [Cyprinodon variegatus]XP_015248667.1 PREDICTED: pentatricopeptide repeat-containing protein 1, mitochondrial-like [Cyprinodon variegatus]
MLAVRCCLRQRSKISVASFSLFSSQRTTFKTLIGKTDRRFTVLPCRLSVDHSARFVSLSASSRADAGASPEQENFGSLSEDISSRRSFRKSSPDLRDLRHERESMEEEPLRRPLRRNTPYWYFLQCKKLIKEKKLQEALDLFSRDMLQEERLQPEEFNYSVLIGGCGRAGQLKKAFKLYNDMKKRGLIATDATYTALFNACAESPSKQAGLQQALKLEQELRRKNYPLSTITYHALLKTHAITNHLQACVHTLREMLQNGHAVTQETFHYLLMGCLKDKEMGFRLALQVWRQMLRSGILPDSKNYTLLLRTARDCGIGDSALASSVLLQSNWKPKEDVSEPRGKNVIDIDLLEKQLFLQHDTQSSSQSESKCNKEEGSNHLIPVRPAENISLPSNMVPDSTAPNLLDLFEGKGGAVLALSSVDTASDRLALIGGAKGFLEQMEAKGLSPDLKTLTLLADMMEPGRQSMQMLLKAAKQHQVKLDGAFFNTAIRRSIKAGALEDAKAVLRVMRQRNVSLNIQTYGCLALGCDQQEEGLQLLKDIEDAGLRPNVHVFSALIGRATRRLDYAYLKTLLKSMRNLSVWPNEVIIRQLEFAAQYPPNYNQYKSRNNYLVHIDGFRGYYQEWLRDVPAQSAEEEQAELQSNTEVAVKENEAEYGLTDAQRNQRAAARRYNSHHRAKKNRTILAQECK